MFKLQTWIKKGNDKLGGQVMDVIRSYKDLCEEIEIWKERIEAYKAEIKALGKLAKVYGPELVTGVDYTQPRVKGTRQIGFEEFLVRLHELENHVFLHEEAIKNMEKCRLNMEERIDRLEGLDKKVVYMRDIEGKRLIDIAEELGYSEIYIKKISARNPKEYT